MLPAPRVGYALLAPALAVAGTYAIVVSIQNNPLEGWGMVLRAIAGQGLWVAAVESGARAMLGRPSRRARIGAVVASSVLLTPAAVIALLMSKEGGACWGLASMVLLVYFPAVAVAAIAVGAISSRSRGGS